MWDKVKNKWNSLFGGKDTGYSATAKADNGLDFFQGNKPITYEQFMSGGGTMPEGYSMVNGLIKKNPASNNSNISMLPAPTNKGETAAPAANAFGTGQFSGSATTTATKTPSYNKTIGDFYNPDEARAAAIAKSDPYYNEKIAQETANAELTKTRATEDYNYAAQVENDAVTSFMEQNGIQGARAGEDLKIALENIMAEKGETRAQSAFDRGRQVRGLLSELAGKGLQFGGMATQAGSEAAKGRELMQNKVERQFTGQENAANLQNTRTVQDLGYASKERKLKDVQLLGENSKYFNEVTSPENASIYKTGSLASTKNRTIADAETIAKQNAADLEQKKQVAIESLFNAETTKAFQSWQADMASFMAQYGL